MGIEQVKEARRALHFCLFFGLKIILVGGDTVQDIYILPQASMVIEMLRYRPIWSLKVSCTSLSPSVLVVGPMPDVTTASTMTTRGYRAIVDSVVEAGKVIHDNAARLL